MSKPITFNSGNQFVAHVLPEPTEGAVPTLKKGISRLKDQRTALKAERDQAQATVSSATQQVADMAIKGKGAKAINEVLAEAAHARFNIATIDEQLDIVSKASSLIGSQLFHVTRSDADWQNYLAASNRWRIIFNDALHALQHEHTRNAISPANVSGWEQQKVAKLEAERKMAARWRESMEDLTDEMIFKFERENEEPGEDGTTKRRSRLRA
jgi:hypothetical protein